MLSITEKIQALETDITTISTQLTRQPPQIIAVSKMFGIDALLEASQAGLSHFGENYLQEALPKIEHLKQANIAAVWHFIGSVQTNKIKQIARTFDWVHGVNSAKAAFLFNQHTDKPLNLCLQVNIDQSPSKSGLYAAELLESLEQVAMLEKINFRGLMCIPDVHNTQDGFKKMQALWLKAQQKILQRFGQNSRQVLNFDTLSMGMSQDWQQAMQYGSTHVRIGQAIFGARNYSKIDTPELQVQL